MASSEDIDARGQRFGAALQDPALASNAIKLYQVARVMARAIRGYTEHRELALGPAVRAQPEQRALDDALELYDEWLTNWD